MPSARPTAIADASVHPVPCRGRAADPRALEAALETVRGPEQIDHGVALEVTALDEHRLGTHEKQSIGGVLHALEVLHLDAGQRRGLRRVRREQRGDRQADASRTPRALLRRAATSRAGDEHRIDDDRDPGARQRAEAPHDRLDHPPRVEHARLHRVRADVVEDDLHLKIDELRIDGRDAVNAERVLRGERRDRRRGVTAERRDGLHVGLDAGAAPESEPATIRTRPRGSMS